MTTQQYDQVIYLVEITAAIDASGTTQVLRYATSPGYRTTASETPANTSYEPRVIVAGNFSRYLYQEGTGGGRSSVGYGEVELDNRDFELDPIHDYGFGRSIVIRRGTTSSAYPGDFETVLSGIVAEVRPEWSIMRVIINDRQGEVASLPYQTTKYLGNNTLPSGHEGVQDLQGKPKPRARGQFLNAPIPCVNTAILTYQISVEQIAQIDAVYDKRAVLTPGTSRASLAALEAASPGASTYDYYLGASGDGAFIKLGSSPVGQVTCDAREGTNAAARSTAQCMQRVITGPGGDGTGFTGASLTALDAKNASVIGHWTMSETTVGAVLDMMARSIGAWWSVTRSGSFVVGRFEAPSGASSFTIVEQTIIDRGQPIERIPIKEQARGNPVYRVILAYQKNYQVMDKNSLAGVALTDLAFVSEEWRTVTSEDASVLTQFPKAGQLGQKSTTPGLPDVGVETLLANKADAQAESDRLLALYKVLRQLFRVVAPTSEVVAYDLDAIGTLRMDRFDWGAGEDHRVVGMEEVYDGLGTMTLHMFA